MSEAFEWFDPYEQKERADREERRANYGEATGRRQVEEALARATSRHLSEKMEMAVGHLAEKIVRQVVIELAGQRAYGDITERMGDEMARLFRRAAMEVVGGLDLPDRARVRLTVDRPLHDPRETMTIQYETLRPIQIASRFEL